MWCCRNSKQGAIKRKTGNSAIKSATLGAQKFPPRRAHIVIVYAEEGGSWGVVGGKKPRCTWCGISSRGGEGKARCMPEECASRACRAAPPLIDKSARGSCQVRRRRGKGATAAVPGDAPAVQASEDKCTMGAGQPPPWPTWPLCHMARAFSQLINSYRAALNFFVAAHELGLRRHRTRPPPGPGKRLSASRR